MGKKQKSRNLTLILAGVALAIFGGNFLKSKIEKFLNGIGYSFSNVRLKIVNITKLQVTGTLTVKNQNGIGGTVDYFKGNLKYGQGGNNIIPIEVSGFQLPARGSASANFMSEIPILQLATNILDVVNAVASGQLKKLWLTGSLKTSFIAIPVDTEISVLSA